MNRINESAWDKLKKQIEYHLSEDNNITDIIINYQVRVPEIGTKNHLRLGVKIND